MSRSSLRDVSATESGPDKMRNGWWIVQSTSGRFASGVRSFYTKGSAIQRLRCDRSACVLVGRGGSMRRFVTLAVLLLFTIPFGVSISGCSKKSPTIFCNGGDSGIPVGQVTTITLQPTDLRHLAELCADRPGEYAGRDRLQGDDRVGGEVHLRDVPCQRHSGYDHRRRGADHRPALRGYLEQEYRRRHSGLHHLQPDQ